MAVADIVFKKVLPDGRYDVTKIPFKIGIATGVSSYTSYYYRPMYKYPESYIDAESSNLLSVFDLDNPGEIVQAFNLDGEELGFRILYKGKIGTDWYQHYVFMIYNEEIGGYALQVTKIRSDVQYESDPKVCLIINGEYSLLGSSPSVENALFTGESYWSTKTSQIYKEGMNNNKHAFMQIVSLDYDEETAQMHYFTSWFTDLQEINGYGRMRYFSSWYKMYTGKFYNQDSMKSMPLINDQEFFIGKVVDYTESPLPSGYEKLQDVNYETSYLFSDIIYGTDPSFYIKSFNYAVEGDIKKGSTEILFLNGATITLEHQGNSLYANLIVNDAEGDEIILKQWGNTMDRLQVRGSGNRYHTSAIQKLLQETSSINFYENYTDDWLSFGPMLFISPVYNDCNPATFISKLQSEEHTADEWRTLLSRVFTFANESVTKIESAELDNLSRVPLLENYSTVAFSGLMLLYENYVFYSSIYRRLEDEDIIYSNVDSAEKWILFIDFTTEEKQPNTGGGSFGGVGGNGSFDNSSDGLDFPTIPGSFLTGSLLRLWWLNDGSDTVTQNNFTALSGWLNNTEIFASFEERVNGVVSFKNIYSPEIPTATETATWEIRGSEVMATGGPTLARYLTKELYKYDYGEFELTKYFDNFLDFNDTSIKIYLPFSGTYDLDPSLLVGGKIKLTLYQNFLTGDIVYLIKVIKNTLESVIYSFNGNASYDLPITSTDYSGKISGYINTALSAVNAVIEKNPLAIANVAFNGVKAFNTPGSVKTTGMTGGSLGVYNVKEPYLIIERPKLQIPENYGKMYGWKTAVGGKLGDYRGMTVVKEVHLNGLGTATANEIVEIERILKTGVIL